MFGISFRLFFLLLLWGGILFIVARLKTPNAQNFRIRMIMLLGVFLVVGAFFFQPWIILGFIDYVDPTASLSRIAPSDLTALTAEKIGVVWLGKIIRLLKTFTRFNGWQIEFIPTFGLFTRVTTILPVFIALIALISIPLCNTLSGGKLAKTIGGFLCVVGFLSALLLLLRLPDLDALGIRGNFQQDIFAVILGAHVGNGPWICLMGLFMIATGGIIEFTASPKEKKVLPEYTF